MWREGGPRVGWVVGMPDWAGSGVVAAGWVLRIRVVLYRNIYYIPCSRVNYCRVWGDSGWPRETKLCAWPIDRTHVCGGAGQKEGLERHAARRQRKVFPSPCPPAR